MQIKIQNVSHTFNPKTPFEFTALKNVSAEINDGEYIGVIGSTGSGKTTLIEHLNNLLFPTSGKIEWEFYDNLQISYKKELSLLKSAYKNAKKKLNLLFQD
ncbi:ATP-binding cassette domain-containing protein [Mycoplasma nasistruthionis]|uniref:ATP-binding cassette domain-containing protein n=1 Tax=Mycoplasma nasistruthionis TaxID=353852 RepID=A0A5B7XWQ0_9MOLU|nr:ATP-binding cassette domain-containing protein [Mycoplasma nasistruthionis]QCZ36964.1 ATP-binding cassette domain-containing protein [Mycoplasma nasistruthionis]